MLSLKHVSGRANPGAIDRVADTLKNYRKSYSHCNTPTPQHPQSSHINSTKTPENQLADPQNPPTETRQFKYPTLNAHPPTRNPVHNAPKPT